MANLVLSVSNLHVSFGSRVVIRGLSFNLVQGDCLAVIGPNGSGKSVLLKALLHLVPGPSEIHGEIRWSEKARLGYVPQRVAADRQLPLRVNDLLEAKAKFLRLPATEVSLAASETGLTAELLDTRIGVLSGGQFQKVLIAFALLGDPNVLLFDEPTASLDELTEERVYESLHSLQKDRGFTVILVSHDLSLVYRYATKVLCLSKVRTCMGAPREILTPQLLEELYAAPAKYYQHVQDHKKG
jgi:zinc transport system ATP-binding protein